MSGGLGEDVRAERRDAPSVAAELEHRPVPEHGLVLVAAEHEPRLAAAVRAARIDTPAAVHPQVAPQHEPALEAQQHVLADRFHRLEQPAVEALGEPFDRRPRMRRLHLHALAGEHLQPPRRPMNRITLRHEESLVVHAQADDVGRTQHRGTCAENGVAADTLRKWEQRYAILQPTRTAGGQRRYTERDVARVEWLRERLEEGYRIGEAASLLGTVGAEPAQSRARSSARILDALDARRDVGDRRATRPGVRAHRRRGDARAVIRPLLETSASAGRRGELTVAEEHLVSEAVRSRLGHLLGDSGGGVRGVAVLACAPGERHELGLMMAAIALRRDGWKVVYLGADTPLGDAFALARRLRRESSRSASRRRTRRRPSRRRVPGRDRAPGRRLGLVERACPKARRVYAGADLRAAVETARALAA